MPFTLKLISKIDEEINLIPPNRSEKALKRLIKLKKKVKLRDSITSLAVTVIEQDLFRVETALKMMTEQKEPDIKNL